MKRLLNIILIFNFLLTPITLFANETGFMLTKEDALADFEYMWETLQANYPHLHSAQHAPYGPQVDVEYVINSGRERIENHSKAYFTSNEFFTFIYDNLIGNFGVLGHLAPRNTRYYFFTDVWERMRESGIYMFELFGDDPMEIQQPFYTKMFYEQLQRPETVAFYEDYARFHNYDHKEYTDEDLIKLARDTFDVWVAGDIVYVHLKTLTSDRFEVSERMIELLQDFFTQHTDAKNVIIDIQGNGGGHAHVWLLGVVAPLWQRPIEARYLGGSLQGELNQYYWGNEVPDNRKTYDPASGNGIRRWRSQFKEVTKNINDEDLLPMDFLSVRTISLPRKPKEALGYKAKVWLLVDERTNSAADNFAYFCRASGFATVVGTGRTRGMGTGGQAHFLSLPRSGLVIDYEPFQGFSYDGLANGITGSLPEILAEEPLAYVLNKIKESESPKSNQTMAEFLWEKRMKGESADPEQSLVDFILENIRFKWGS